VSVKLNHKNIDALKINLGLKLYEGCNDAAAILRNNTPIDTKRLWKSTRPIGITVTKDAIRSGVVAGGVTLPGITREQNINKVVVYAIYVNNRTGYIEECIPQIVDAIERRLGE
jgi:hypothetical protein